MKQFFFFAVVEDIGRRTFEKVRSGGSTKDISTTKHTVTDLFEFVKKDPLIKSQGVFLIYARVIIPLEIPVIF